MRVLQVYRTYFPDPPGGLQEGMRQVALNARDYGVKTRIMALSPTPDPQEIQADEGTIVRAKSYLAPASCDIGGLSSFALFRREALRADVVHLHFPWPFGDLLRFALPTKKPALLAYHSDIVRQKWLGRAYHPLMQMTLNAVNAVVAESPQYAAGSPVLQNVPKDKLYVIPTGIKDRTGQPRDATILERLGIKPEGYVLSLSVLRYYKGLHTLVAAAPHIPLPVVIAGSGTEEERLKKQAAETGATNVIFAGQVSEAEKWALLAGCKALAFPSHLRSEALGLTLVEALMFGKPVVSCAIGTGTSFVNKDGATGIEVPAEDSKALGEALRQFCDNDDLASRMGSAGRARYEELFSGSYTGRAYAELYQKLIAA